MIIWINGPYGVGKSTLARELHKRLADSFLFDAEAVGDAVRDNFPPQFFKETYEEFSLWHETCYRLLKELDTVYDGDILIAMTLTCPESHTGILERLKQAGVSVTHILLESDYKTVHDRILARGEEEGCWCMEQIDHCLTAQNDFPCDLRVQSLNKTPESLAEEILYAIKQK